MDDSLSTDDSNNWIESDTLSPTIKQKIKNIILINSLKNSIPFLNADIIMLMLIKHISIPAIIILAIILTALWFIAALQCFTCHRKELYELRKNLFCYKTDTVKSIHWGQDGSKINGQTGYTSEKTMPDGTRKKIKKPYAIQQNILEFYTNDTLTVIQYFHKKDEPIAYKIGSKKHGKRSSWK